MSYVYLYYEILLIRYIKQVSINKIKQQVRWGYLEMTIALVFGTKGANLRSKMMLLRDDLDIDVYTNVSDLISGSQTRRKVYNRIIIVSSVIKASSDVNSTLQTIYDYWRSFCPSSEFILFAREEIDDVIAKKFTNILCSPLCTAVLVRNTTAIIIEALASDTIQNLNQTYGIKVELDIDIEEDSYATIEPEPKLEQSISSVQQTNNVNSQTGNISNQTQQQVAKKGFLSGLRGIFGGKKQKGVFQPTDTNSNQVADNNFNEVALNSGENLSNSEVENQYNDTNSNSAIDYEQNNDTNYGYEGENYGEYYDEQYDTNASNSSYNDYDDGVYTENSDINSIDSSCDYNYNENENYSENYSDMNNYDSADYSDVDNCVSDDYAESNDLGINAETGYSDINNYSTDDFTESGEYDDITEESGVAVTDEFTDEVMSDDFSFEGTPDEDTEDFDADFNADFGDEDDTDFGDRSTTASIEESVKSFDNQDGITGILKDEIVETGVLENSDNDNDLDNLAISDDNDSTVTSYEVSETFDEDMLISNESVETFDESVSSFNKSAKSSNNIVGIPSGFSQNDLETNEVVDEDFSDIDFSSDIDEEEESSKDLGVNINSQSSFSFEPVSTTSVQSSSSVSNTGNNGTVLSGGQANGVSKRGKGKRIFGGIFGRGQSKEKLERGTQELGVSTEPVIEQQTAVTSSTSSPSPSPSVSGSTLTSSSSDSVRLSTQAQLQSHQEVSEVADDDLFGDINIANLDDEYKKAEAEANVRIERVEVVREVIKEVVTSDSNTGNSILNSIIKGKSSRVFLITGDRGTGITTLAYELAQEFAKHVPVLYFDGDVTNHGLLNYISIERFCEYDMQKQQGVKMCRSMKAFNNCVMRYDDNFDLVSTMFGTEVSDDEFETAQSVIMDASSGYPIVIADIPFDKLHLCQELIGVATIIVTAEKSKRGLMNLACRFDTCTLAVRYKRKISSTGILMLTKGDTKVDTKKLKTYVSDIVDFDEEDSNWLNMRTLDRVKVDTKFLQTILN